MLLTRFLHRFPLSGVFVYWALFPALYVYNRLPGPPRTRAIIVRGDKILVVRNWIGDQEWTLPGGGRKRSETELDALVRETDEEVGLTISPATATHLATVRLESYRSPFTVSVYRCSETSTSQPLRRSLEYPGYSLGGTAPVAYTLHPRTSADHQYSILTNPKKSI